MGASLRDVAKLAGVSVKTVSNVVNDYAHVTDRTRERVQRAIDELNYRPNPAARTLRRGRSGIIGLAIPEVGIPYFAELAGLIVDAAAEKSWTVLIDQTGGMLEREMLVSEGMRAHVLDGLIFSPIAMGSEDLAARRDDTPMVLLGERIFDGPADHVAIDNVAAARDVTAHLVASGRRRVAAIGAQHTAEGDTARLRLAGYGEALRAAGMVVDDALIAPAPAWHRADGAAAMRTLLAAGPPPDAALCFNDTLALGAIRALHDAGLRVPDDVAIAGFDDIEDGRYSVPTLTTVAPDKEHLARIAVDLLAARLGPGDGAPPREETVPHRLHLRESTGSALTPPP